MNSAIFPQDSSLPESIYSEELSKPHILIVDDEPEIRELVSLCLQKHNFRITCAGDAAEASKLLVQDQFDVILSDVMMPGEDGILFLGRVHESWPELPVVLMTGHAQLKMAVNAIKNGAFDFIHKPIDFDYLRKIVLRAVNYRNLQRMEKNYRAELEEMVARRTAELKLSMAELDVARAAMQQAASDKSTFMSTISHEMRTPMNGVIGSLELLSEENLTGSAPEYLAMARQSADNMVALIDQMLSFTPLVIQGDGALSRDLVDLKSFFQSIISVQMPHFARKGIKLSLQISDDLPQQILTERDKLCRLFDILFDNALKFTTQGEVSLKTSRIFSEPEGEMLQCVLADSGSGIPYGMLERIFEPFVQGDGSFTRCHEGVGLGLAIARQNALLLNGRLWAEHVPTGGSSFILNLKLNTP